MPPTSRYHGAAIGHTPSRTPAWPPLREHRSARRYCRISPSSTTADSGTHSIFLCAPDTGFTGSQSQLLAIGGTNSGDNGTVTGRAWGGTSNTALQFGGATC